MPASADRAARSGSGFLRAVFTIGGLTMASRVLGLVRDVLIANALGASYVADAFFVAFKLPNFFRRLFAEGAFNAAFIPLFAESLAQSGRDGAKAMAEETTAVLLAVLVPFVLLMQYAMPVVMMGLGPGFIGRPETFDLAVDLARLTFPYLLFISLVSLFGGMLNSVGRFAATAATPILLNLCLIGAALFAVSNLTSAGHALALGVAVAGIAQFLFLAAALRGERLLPRLPAPKLTPQVKRLLRLMLPAALGAGVVQINLVIDLVLASLLPTGAVSYLFYADRLNQLPVGVVGVAVGTALLPMLSRQIASGEGQAAIAGQNRAIELALLLTLPAAMALIVIPGPLISFIFEHGAFGAEDTAATVLALMAYALGLPAYVLIKVLGPGFYARQDTATPVKIAMAALVVNLVFNLLLIGPLQHAGLALATAISAWVNAGLLAWVLRKRGHFIADPRLKARLWRMAAATLVMGLALWGLLVVFEAALDGAFWWRLAALAALVIGGLLAYGLAVQVTGAMRLGDLRSLFRGRHGG